MLLIAKGQFQVKVLFKLRAYCNKTFSTVSIFIEGLIVFLFLFFLMCSSRCALKPNVCVQLSFIRKSGRDPAVRQGKLGK